MEIGQVAKEKICIVAPAYLTIGGLGSIVRQLIKVLEANYRVTVLSLKRVREGKWNFAHYDIALNSKIELLFNPGHIPSLLLYELSGVLWCLVLRISGIQKFLVQEAVVSSFFSTLVARITGANVFLFDYGPMLSLYDPKFTKEPIGRISTFRRGLLQALYTNLLKIMNKFSLRHCSKLFVYNQEFKECALQNGLEAGKIVSYNFPIDEAFFKECDSATKVKIRDRLGIKRNEVVVTFVGRISGDKGLPYLLEAAKALIKKNQPQIKFLIVGEGSLMRWFREKAEWSGDSMMFLGPLYKASQVAEVLNASDIFVYPVTLSYGYALSFLEAMATGLPGVVTDVGPTKELIVNRYNGIIIPAGDAKSLTKALEQLVTNEKLRKYIGKNAKATLAKFSTGSYRKIILQNIA